MIHHGIRMAAYNTTETGHLTITVNRCQPQPKPWPPPDPVPTSPAPKTRYPGTNLLLKYAIKTKAPTLIN